MTARDYWRLFLVLVVWVIFSIQTALAQDSRMTYIVTSDRDINARGCARLDCAVVTTFAPDEILASTGTVSGDVVSGSDRWVAVAYDEDTVYVHGSLVAVVDSDDAAADDPAPVVGLTASAQAANEAAAAANNEPQLLTATVNTDQWVRRVDRGISLMTPPEWLTIADLLESEDYFARLSRGMTHSELEQHRALVEGLYQDYAARAQGLLMVFVDPYGSGVLMVFGQDYGVRVSPEFLLETMALYVNSEAEFEMEILTSKILRARLGDCGHLVVSMGTGRDQVMSSFFAFMVETRGYTIEMTYSANQASYYAEHLAAIVNSFSFVGNIT